MTASGGTMRYHYQPDKFEQAETIVYDCFGRQGVWAGTGRYAHQNWTRDFVFATMPHLLWAGENAIVERHLDNLSRRIRPNGQVPILFLDGPQAHLQFLLTKGWKSLRDGKMSFMLRRYLQGELWNLTPGTRDSEILYLLAMGKYGF